MGVEDSHFKTAFFEDNSDSFWARVASLLVKAMFLDAVVAYIDPSHLRNFCCRLPSSCFLASF